MRDYNEAIFRVIALCVLTLLVTILHYMTSQEEGVLHVVYRELYFFPIILAGFWFGIRGGLSTSLVITALYLPVIISHLANEIGSHNVGNLLEIVLFNVIGLLVGWLRNRERSHWEARREAEALASMGRAVSCIAHDMKTPLMTIGGFTQQVWRKLPEDDKLGQKLAIVLQQTQRLELLVKDMLAFARPLKLECRDGDFNTFIRDTIVVAQEKARVHNVVFSLELQEGLPRCYHDPLRLQQALLNIINNAVEASPSGEKVTIRSGFRQGDLAVEVEDRGEGLAPDKMKEIVQPFISCKKEGTGLGLPIVNKIMEAHGGMLHYEQNSTGGMVFTLILPAAL